MATLLHDLIRDYGDDPEKVVALVRAMGEHAVDHLLPLLRSGFASRRAIAGHLLALIGDRRAVEPLIAAALDQKGLFTSRLREHEKRRREGYPSWGCFLFASGKTRYEIARVLDGFEADEVAEVRRECALALGTLGDKRATKALRILRNDTDAGVREAARIALACLGEL